MRGASLLEHAAQVAVRLRVGRVQRQSRAVAAHRLALRAARRAPQPLSASSLRAGHLQGTAVLCAAGVGAGAAAALRADGEQELGRRRVELTTQELGGRRVGGRLWCHSVRCARGRTHGASCPAPQVRTACRRPVCVPLRTARLRHGCGTAHM